MKTQRLSILLSTILLTNVAAAEGTIPNYADSNDGLLLDGVRDDSPAAKGGLKAGDRIVKIANRDIKNVYDYTYALGELKAGEEIEVVLRREGREVRLKLTPEKRK